MEVSIEVTGVATNAFQVISDNGDGTGTPYADLATLLAAGKVPFPNLPQTQPAHLVLVAHVQSADTSGSAFRFRTNSDTIPVQGPLVLSGVTYSYPSWSMTDKILLYNLWIKAGSATDYINITAIL